MLINRVRKLTRTHVIRDGREVKFRVGRVEDGHEELRFLVVVNLWLGLCGLTLACALSFQVMGILTVQLQSRCSNFV